MAQNTKKTNGSTTSNPRFNYSHARSGVIMSFFRPHVHSICMRCINWPSMKWTTLHASNYHMGWILVQNCVRPLYPRVRAREWVRAWCACTSSLRACTASMAQGGRVHSSGTSNTSLWSIHARRSRQRLHMCHMAYCVACHWYSNLHVLHILEALVIYMCIARIRFCNQIMNKYHTIACKLWVIYAWCSPSFNSYSSSHSKSISFYKKKLGTRE